MSDIIETIDRLHAEAKAAAEDLETAKIEDQALFLSMTKRAVALQDAVIQHWPALRERLREAERRLANNYGPNGVVIRDLVDAGREIVRLQNALAEAERKASDANEELKSVLADWNEARSASGSKTNGGLVGHIAELRRKAKAFDLIASGDIGLVREPIEDSFGFAWLVTNRDSDWKWHSSPDLLTAIEAATKEHNT